jgi:threonine/homoserine/homoserine lactone efflux protein
LLLYTFLFGMALGFTLTVPPGPMNALIASEASSSIINGVLTGSGAMSADMLLAFAVYMLRSHLSLSDFIQYFYLTGAAVMVYFSYSTFRYKQRTGKGSGRYLRALLLGVSNPFQILWWLTAGLAFAYLGGLLLLAGLFTAVAVWIIIFPAAIYNATRRHERAQEVVRYVSAGIMSAFAIYLAYLFILHSN